MLLKADCLRYWDEHKKRLVFEKDKVEVLVGTSSADIQFVKVVDATN